jgi:hypothetical protein
MNAAATGESSSAVSAAEASAGGAPAFLATAAWLAGNAAPADDAGAFDPAPWEIDETAGAASPFESIDDIVFLAFGDRAAAANDDGPAFACATGGAVLADADDAPADATHRAPWEIEAVAPCAPGSHDADATIAAAPEPHWMDAFDAGADPVADGTADWAADDLAFAPDVAWFAPDAQADPPHPVDFAAGPARGPVDVAALLDGFGYAGAPDGDAPGGDALALFPVWPATPPDGADADVWSP